MHVREDHYKKRLGGFLDRPGREPADVKTNQTCQNQIIFQAIIKRPARRKRTKEFLSLQNTCLPTAREEAWKWPGFDLSIVHSVRERNEFGKSNNQTNKNAQTHSHYVSSTLEIVHSGSLETRGRAQDLEIPLSANLWQPQKPPQRFFCCLMC